MEFEPIPDRRPTPTPTPSESGPKNGRRAKPPRRWARRIWRTAWIWLSLIGLACGAMVAAAINMPEVDALEEFTPGLVTRLFDHNGDQLRTYAVENRVLLREGDLPQVLVDAIVAVEDERFFRHGGVDLRGVLRAVKVNLKAGEIAEGASTLTMQLAENLFNTRGRSWKRKISEALLAVEIEKRYSKQQILTMYANVIYMGEGNYGMQSATRAFFNKNVADVSLVEAASLAGIPQRPNGYSPYKFPEDLVTRRNHVLRRMLDTGAITEPEYREAIEAPLLVAPKQRREDHGLGPYFSEEVRRYLESRFGAERLYEAGLQVHTTIDPLVQATAESATREQLLALDHRRGWRGPIASLDADLLADPEMPSWQGVTVRPNEWYEGVVLSSDRDEAQVQIGDALFELGPTGVEWTKTSSIADLLAPGDVAWFRLAAPALDATDDEAATDGEGEDESGNPTEAPAFDPDPTTWTLHLEQEPEIEAAALVIESATGAVRAMVGGFDFGRSKFNRATQARRQVGSAFKPFVYGAAIENGYTPADTLFDAPVGFPGADPTQISYSPRNHTRRYYGITTLRRALESSINVTSVKLLDLVGVDRVIDFARRCGITSDLPPYPSLALGAADIAPIELAAAYSTFANQGIHVEPYLVERITTAAGRLLEEHMPRAHKAIEPEVAFVLTHMLEGVVDRGSGASMARLDVALAGKTGTTNAYTDAWFVGFSPEHTMLVWVGRDKKLSLGRGMTGSAAALPVWKGVAEAGLEAGWIQRGTTFPVPPGVSIVPIDHATGLLPGSGGATRIIDEGFLVGTEPTQTTNEERRRITVLPWYQQRSFYLPKEGERMPDHVDAETWALILEGWEEKNESESRLQ